MSQVPAAPPLTRKRKVMTKSEIERLRIIKRELDATRRNTTEQIRKIQATLKAAKKLHKGFK